MNPIHRSDRFYDYVKHLTTLSTGSIVIIATFVDKFSKNSSYRFLLTISFAALTISLLCSMVSMLYTLSYQPYTNDNRNSIWEYKVVRISFMGTISSLVIGLVSLSIFADINF